MAAFTTSLNSAYDKLEELNVLEIIKMNLKKEKVLHTDETGININGNRQWLHNASSSKWTYLATHENGDMMQWST